MTDFLRRIPSHHLAIVVLPGTWAVVTLLLLLYWRCLQLAGPDTQGVEIVQAVVSLVGVALLLANVRDAMARRRWVDTLTYTALIVVLVTSLLTPVDDVLLLVALAWGVVAPALASEARLPLPQLSLAPGFLLGALLLQADMTAEFGRLTIVLGLALFALMSWQRTHGGIPLLQWRGLALAGLFGVLAVPGTVLAMSGYCDRLWCYDQTAYGPVVETLRHDLPDDAAVLTVLDPGTYDQIFQRCRLESDHVYRAYYPSPDVGLAEELMDYITGNYHQVYGVFVDADLDAYDVSGTVQTALHTDGYLANSSYTNFVRIDRYGIEPPTDLRYDLNAQFGDGVTLLSVTFTNDSVAPGEILGVVLTWEVDAAIDASAGVYLLNADGALVSQNDAAPDWQQSTVVEDRRGIAVPAGILPGQYDLCTALYTQDGRLPIIVDDAPQPDLLCITDIAVVPR